jgi:hypothetical protein
MSQGKEREHPYPVSCSAVEQACMDNVGVKEISESYCYPFGLGLPTYKSSFHGDTIVVVPTMLCQRPRTAFLSHRLYAVVGGRVERYQRPLSTTGFDFCP